MPCDARARQAAEQAAFDAALDELAADLAAGRKTISRALNGQLAISNWSKSTAAQAGWCEGCALVKLANTGSPQVRARLAAFGLKAGASFVVASHAGHAHTVKVGHGHGHGHGH